MARAQTAVTSDISILDTSDSQVADPQTFSGVAGAVGSSDAGNNYDVTYNGTVTSVTGFTAGSVNYSPLNYSAGTVTTTLVRSNADYTTNGGNSPNNNVIYNRIVSSDAGAVTVASPYIGSESSAFNTNNLNVGTDNLFGNQGDGSGNNNNIERVDVVFSAGLTATQALSFVVMERGVSTAHDNFQIAAITSISGGVPTGFGSLISFGNSPTTPYGKYGQTALAGTGSANWLVSRNSAENDGTTADAPSITVGPQSIGGVAVAVTDTAGNSGLGVGVGDTIYGYSIFGGDVSGSGSELLDVNNSSVFPEDSSSATGAGGIDLIAYTGVAFDAAPVPEPSQYGMILFLLVGVFYLGRFFSRKSETGISDLPR